MSTIQERKVQLMNEQRNQECPRPGMYDPSFEHDNCGIGAVVNIKGVKSHKTVEDALSIVENLEHRAGKDAEGKTGDGVGIMVQISHKFFSKECAKLGIELGGEREYVEPAKGTVNPRVFIDRLAKKMPANVTVVADVGQNQIWTCTEYKFRKEGRLLTSGGMGTMGYSVPAAIGAKMADDSRATVAICGDGAFQMSFMELATAVQFGVDIKVVVMTNNRLGMVRELQTNGYHDRQTAVFLDGSPDFIKLAEAYGIPAMRVYDDDTMEKGIEMLAEHKGICLVEVVVDKDMPTL